MWTSDRAPSSPGDFNGGAGGYSTLDAVTPGFQASVAAIYASGANPAQARAEFAANFPHMSIGSWALGFGALLVGLFVVREVL